MSGAHQATCTVMMSLHRCRPHTQAAALGAHTPHTLTCRQQSKGLGVGLGSTVLCEAVGQCNSAAQCLEQHRTTSPAEAQLPPCLCGRSWGCVAPGRGAVLPPLSLLPPPLLLGAVLSGGVPSGGGGGWWWWLVAAAAGAQMHVCQGTPELHCLVDCFVDLLIRCVSCKFWSVFLGLLCNVRGCSGSKAAPFVKQLHVGSWGVCAVGVCRLYSSDDEPSRRLSVPTPRATRRSASGLHTPPSVCCLGLPWFRGQLLVGRGCWLPAWWVPLAGTCCAGVMGLVSTLGPVPF